MNQIWSYVLTLMGVSCFWLAGRKIWWAWYVGLSTQAVWLAYSLVTHQWGFLFGTVFYTGVYVTNQRRWSAEHRKSQTDWTDLDPAEQAEALITEGTYRKTALMVDARSWDGSYDRAQEILEWVGQDRGLYQEAIIPGQTTDVGPLPATPAHLFIYTASGAVEVLVGQYVIKEPDMPGRIGLSVESPSNMHDLYTLVEEG